MQFNIVNIMVSYALVPCQDISTHDIDYVDQVSIVLLVVGF